MNTPPGRNAYLFGVMAAALTALERRPSGMPLCESWIYEAYCGLRALPSDVEARLGWHITLLLSCIYRDETLAQEDLEREWERRVASGDFLIKDDLPPSWRRDLVFAFAVARIRAHIPAGTVATVLPPERPYRLVREPCDRALRELFEAALVHCDEVRFHAVPGVGVEPLRGELSSFYLPVQPPCRRRVAGPCAAYALTAESAAIIRGSLAGLYDAHAPFGDFALVRRSGLVWLDAARHSAEGAIHLTTAEREALRRERPALSDCLATLPVFSGP